MLGKELGGDGEGGKSEEIRYLENDKRAQVAESPLHRIYVQGARNAGGSMLVRYFGSPELARLEASCWRG